MENKILEMAKSVGLEEIIEDLQKQYDSFKTSKVKIAISGQSGSGKSSLINAIFGEKKAAVGSTETTTEIKSYIHGNTEFFDLPGCGTKSFPVENYIAQCDLLSYDAFIIVTANRFYENDEWLISQMVKAGRPVYVVRTKLDESIINEKRDNDLNAAQVYSKIQNDIITNLKDISIKGVYILSSVRGVVEDFRRLLDDINKSLDSIKRERFIADSVPYSDDIIKAKRKIAESIVTYRAFVAAANGLNPIPGVDVAVDIAILQNLAKEVREVFGVTDEQIAYFERKNGNSERFQVLKTNALKYASRFIAKEGIVLLLKSLAPKVASKTVLKYVPFVGQFTSATIGYYMTDSFGQDIIKEAEEMAKEALDISVEFITE